MTTLSAMHSAVWPVQQGKALSRLPAGRRIAVVARAVPPSRPQGPVEQILDSIPDPIFRSAVKVGGCAVNHGMISSFQQVFPACQSLPPPKTAMLGETPSISQEPLAFWGGVFAGALRLNLQEDPLRAWLDRTARAAQVQWCNPSWHWSSCCFATV